MATTYTDNGGGAPNGSDKIFTFTFPVLQNEDVKVALNGVTQATTKYTVDTSTNPTQIEFNNTSIDSSVQETTGAPKSGVTVRVFRETTVGKANGDDDPKAVFAAGSSIRASDLNANTEQALYAIHELQNQPIKTDDVEDGAIISSKILDGTIVEGDLANSAVTQNKLANNSVGTPELINGSVTSDKILNGTIVNADISPSAAIDGSKIASSTGSVAGTMSASDKAKLDGIESGAKDDQTASEIKTLLQSDKITNSEIATGTLDGRYFTETELTNGALDGRYFTETESDARYFNISSGETIKDGDTFPDNDTTIATTAAINDRIIDLIDDVGGFDIIQSEQHFPNTNPQGTTGQAAVLSVKAASTDLVPSGTTVTINNGNLANNANITITGVPGTIPSGFGFLVESTTTLHTYAFHRLVPKATEVTTVAGKATEIGRLGTAAAVEDMSILGTTDVVADMAILGTTDVVADMNLLATSDVISDMNTLAVSSVLSDLSTAADAATNINNVGNNITNVNSVSNSAGANQTFTVTVQNVSGNKYFVDGVQTPVLKLARGKTYTFNLADSSNSGHPLAFRDSSDNSYTTGVTTSGTAGSPGATVVIVVAANAPSSLKYYCTSHGNAMGNTINVIDDNVGTVAGSISNVNTVGGAISNVNTTAGSISNVNTVATNINAINDFTDVYRVGSQNPTNHLTIGDLFFNTTSNSLKVYTGSAWVDGVTATGNFAVVTGNTFTGSNNHNDNVKSIYGSGSDLEIYHSSGDSHITNSDGNLNIVNSTDGWIRLQPKSGEEGVIVKPDGAVELYYDGTKKFEISSAGAQISGHLQLVGHLDMDDDHKIKLGTGDDLEIFHGSNISTIKDTYGDLRIMGDTIRIQRQAGGENFLFATEGGKTSLYFDGSEKIQTTAIGVTINGDLKLPDNENVRLGDSNDLILYHNGIHSYIQNGTGNLYLDTTGNFYIRNGTGSSTYMYASVNEVALYYSNTKRFETTANGVEISGRLFTNGADYNYLTSDSTTNATLTLKKTDGNADSIDYLQCRNNANSPKFIINGDGSVVMYDNSKLKLGNSADLQIFHSGTDSFIQNYSGDLNIRGVDGKWIYIQAKPNENSIICKDDAAVELYYDNSLKFQTVSSGTKWIGDLNCDDNSKIKIGNSQDLEIYHDGSHSYVAHDGTGALRVRGDLVQITDIAGGGGGNSMATFTSGGSARLFHNNNYKFETSSTGVTVNGTCLVGGNLELNSDAIIKIGAGNDLQIYHDGSHSYVSASGTGALKLLGNNNDDVQIQPRSGYNSARFKPNNAVELYYDNSKKIESKSNGAIAHGSGAIVELKTTASTGNNWLQFSDSSGNQKGYLGYGSGTNETLYLVQHEGANISIYIGNAIRWNWDTSGHFIPQTNNQVDIGSTSNRVRNVYTNDLHLSNEGSSNDVDQTWGDWTIQEGESDLFLKNNRSGKKYKFNLTEVS